ncbi:MAG TPA: enolase C-terminal domain-like protein [Amycolatopsis sp.]|jgi:muconate cycloisomerase|nr:enolase C-terminal domain-like protein [Amycolatopsis sp.]
MKIVAVEAIPVRVPRARPSRSAFGVRDHTEAGVIRIDTDAGITGWGEICLVWWRQGSGLCHEVATILAPALIGADPTAITLLSRRMAHLLPGRFDAPARAGVEMALLDICGKAAGIGVHQLLGGAVRDHIDLSFSLHMNDPAAMAEDARERAEAGFTTLKVKIGREWAADRAALTAVRDAVGDDVAIRVDVNEAWRSVPLAARRLAELAEFDVELVEQPLPGEDLDGMAELRHRSEIPLAADESVWSYGDALRIVRARAADVLNVYFSEAGGLWPARQIAELAAAAGLPIWIGSMPELGLGTAANAHLAAAVGELDLASDVCGFAYHAQDLLTEPLRVVAGRLAVPRGPGLGVSVDAAALDRFRIDR